ncbi:MAG: hypothetical protein LC802_13565 [Acidobacteria bacterium]|nr:hypothetical protein [Acidobacteriota bacterium]
MSEDKQDELATPIQTDAESQEYGALHGQNAEGEETGSSGDAAQPNDKAQKEDAQSGEGTGAAAGEYS